MGRWEVGTDRCAGVRRLSVRNEELPGNPGVSKTSRIKDNQGRPGEVKADNLPGEKTQSST